MLLLDTCTLLWLTSDQAKLSATAQQAISANAGWLCVSAISGFEIAQKVAKGKLVLPRPPAEWMELALRLHGLKSLALEMDSAISAGALPALHADPFDRLLIAIAQARRLTLLTPDPLIRQYPALTTLW
jgi:PIN domain nuclease of toxin-antitoxin system